LIELFNCAMAKAEHPPYYLSLKSLFEHGNVTRMRDIDQLFPTKVAADLKLNYSRYVDKLYHPQKFSFDQVARFAGLLDIEPHKIATVIFKEMSMSKVRAPRKKL